MARNKDPHLWPGIHLFQDVDNWYHFNVIRKGKNIIKSSEVDGYIDKGEATRAMIAGILGMKISTLESFSIQYWDHTVDEDDTDPTLRIIVHKIK